jgi:hypothetical protein
MAMCKDLSYLLPALTKAPRIFLEHDDDNDLAESEEILSSVAEHWIPLRRAIESGEVDLPGDGDDE